MNPTGIGLCLLNDWFFDGKADGLVLTDEQHEIENYLDIQSVKLISSHHQVDEIPRVFDTILNDVNKAIERIRK